MIPAASCRTGYLVMAISSGLRNVLSEGASWLVAAALLFAGMVYQAELREALYAFAGSENPGAPPTTSSQRPAQQPQGLTAEQRIRQAETRAAEAEARAREAEARARSQQTAAARPGSNRTRYGNTIELKASRDGHHYANAEINGRPINVLVDTGASSVALTWDDAQRAGIFVSDGDFTGRTQTANGQGRYAPVTIDQIMIGSIMVSNVRGVVLERGKLQVTLLGMSFLSKLIRTEMRDGVLVLEN
jgi:aspartyl protease family protein